MVIGLLCAHERLVLTLLIMLLIGVKQTF